MLNPLYFVAALGKVAVEAQALGQFRKNIEVVASITEGGQCRGHGGEVVIVGAAAQVIALKGSGYRQHNVRMAGGGGPHGLVDHNRPRFLPGAYQPIQVLVVVKRIAACPVHQVNTGVGQPVSVVTVGCPGFSSMSVIRATGINRWRVALRSPISAPNAAIL